MHYCAIKDCDIADGVGVRVSLFVSGCTNRCEGCFQPETWDFNYGEEFTEETQETIFKMLEPAYIRGLTILGGEPMEPSNQRALLPFLKEFRKRFPKKDLWMFSGFRYEDEITVPGNHANCEVTEELISLLDILVEGRFELALKKINLKFRGSSNQRIIDIKETLKCGEVILWDEKKASN